MSKSSGCDDPLSGSLLSPAEADSPEHRLDKQTNSKQTARLRRCPEPRAANAGDGESVSGEKYRVKVYL